LCEHWAKIHYSWIGIFDGNENLFVGTKQYSWKVQNLFMVCAGNRIRAPYELSTQYTVKPVLSNTKGKHKKWLLKAGGCLTEVNIRTNLTFGNILFGCLRKVGCLIEVTANTGLTVLRLSRCRISMKRWLYTTHLHVILINII